MKTVFSSAWTFVKNIFSSSLSWIGGKVSSGLGAVKGTFTTILNSLKGIVSSAFNAVKSAITGGMNGALNAVKNFFGKFKTAGSNIVGSIADGINGAVGKVTGAIGNVVSKVRDFLPFSPAKTGPLMDLDELDFAGPMTDSIDKAKRPLSRAMNDLMESASVVMDDMINLPNATGIVNRAVASGNAGSVNTGNVTNVNNYQSSMQEELIAALSKVEVRLDGEETVGRLYPTINRIGGEQVNNEERLGRR